MNTQEATIPSGNCTPGRPERANFFFGPTFDLDSEPRPFSACATGGRELGLGRLDIDWGAQQFLGSLHQDQN